MYQSLLNSNSNRAGGAGGDANNPRSSRGFKNRNVRIDPPTKDQLTSGMADKTLLQLSQRILGGKAVVKHVMGETAFIIYHEDFRQEFVIRQIPDQEDITRWIDLQTHSNIITAFDSFIEESTGCHFSMVEANNSGSIFQYIKRLNLNLAIDVPRSYIENIFDIAIQLTQGMDFAHNSGLVHGQFDLSKVLLQVENDNIMYKITDFAPASSMDMPLSVEASYWPFSKQKKQVTDREKTEVIMMKDIYSLGIAILELMIGRTSRQTYSISLDNLPLTWAEYPESTPLIQVLVECIQIDSITQRKGRLQGIKKLLIREYKKFFQKPIYKMENPFVGKKADVYNKKGIVALFHDKEGEALHWWSQARLLCDRHFDSMCNFSMHRWSTGYISDEQLLAELDEFVFSVPGKGETLHAYLLISMGEREQGKEILKNFIARSQEALEGPGRLKNLKLKNQLARAKEVFDVLSLTGRSDKNNIKSEFPNNITQKHEHLERITCMSFSDDGFYLVTISSDMTKVIGVGGAIGVRVKIPGNLEDEFKEEKVDPVACVNNSGTLVVTYRGKLTFHFYKCKTEDDYQKDENGMINLRREIIANGINDFNYTPGRDKVREIKFLYDEAGVETHLRVYMIVDGTNFISDVRLQDQDYVADLRRTERYSDQAILNLRDDKMTPQMLVRQENMKKLIAEQNELGNDIIFPSHDMRLVVVFSKEDRNQKHYKIYDNLRNAFIRRVQKRTMFDEATAINANATRIAFIEDKNIVLRSIRMPNNATLIDNLRPRIAVAESKLNPAQATLNRQTYKDKLYRELHAYHMFKDNPLAEKTLGLTEEQNAQLMVLKYEEGVNAPYKLKANRELMMLQKVLLRDAVKTQAMKDLQAQCPLVGVEGVKRIEIYDDELTFNTPESKIQHVAMSSEPHRNFFLIAMDGLVYKYDLVSKELLFQFKTTRGPEVKQICLYDKDDKLVVTSAKEIRLWDFYDHREEAPELITAEQISDEDDFTVDRVFVNKNSKCGALYVLLTCRSKFILYTGRLEVKFRQELEDQNEHVTAAAFNKDCSLLLIGTSSGKVFTYKVSDGELDGNHFQAGAADISVTQIVTLNNIDENEAYLMTVGGKELYVFIHNKKDSREIDFGEDGQVYMGQDICNVQAALNNKFFMIGVPSKRAIGFFGLNRIQLTCKPLKWVTKYPFENFYADDHLSTMMLIDSHHRALDFQYILWRFDTKDLDMGSLSKLDAGPGQDGQDMDEDGEYDTMGNESAAASGGKKVEQGKSSCCTIF